MDETIEVFVNGTRVGIYRGMQVKHALLAYDQSVYASALSGEVGLEDENGFTLGLEGGLTAGAKIFVTPQRR